MRLPEGKDPDELIRRDPASWPAVVASAQPFLDFYIDAALSSVDLADVQAKSAAVRRLMPLLEAAGDQVVQAHYAGIIARKLQLPESSVLRELRRSAVRSTASRSSRGDTGFGATFFERRPSSGVTAPSPRNLPARAAFGADGGSRRRAQSRVVARPPRP